MRRIPRLFAVVGIALVFAAPAYPTKYLFETVEVDSTGTIQGLGMSGPSESPANVSPGTGFATALYDDVANTLAIDVTFQGLLGTTSASHIHSATVSPFLSTAGVATTTPEFTGFPNGVTSGSFSTVLNLTQSTSFNPAFNSGVNQQATLIAGMFANKSYLNIHTSAFPSGEIRGFLVLVPEPATASLIGLGVAAIGCFARRRR